MCKRRAAAWIAAVLISFAAGSRAPAREAAPPDTAASSAALDSLQARMERSWWGGWLTDFIFVGRASSDTADVLPVTQIQTEEQYLPYGGRFIRRIDVARFPLFNTEDVIPQGLLRVGNAVHVDTREHVIRGYILVEEGAPLDPYALADTERLLRSTPFIQDATVVVIPVPESGDSVDLLVITQDVWSIGVAGSIRGVGMYKGKVFERNFMGLGHVIEFDVDVSDGRSQEVNYGALYSADNIGGTFLDFDVSYFNSHIENRPQAVLSRPFRAVSIDYGGALRLSRVEVKDTAAVVERSYDFHDLWVGRAFRRGGAVFDAHRRRQLTVSGRVATTRYVKRDSIDADSDRFLHDSTFLLGGVSWSHSEYRKALLLKSYGTTDDIGTGYLFSIAAGYEFGEFSDRWYAGAGISGGRFGRTLGYYSWLLEAGGFVEKDDFQDGVLRLNLNGFSNLGRSGQYRHRLFYGADYLSGFDRQSAAGLVLKVPGIETDIEDYQRLIAGVEAVTFTPWRFLGLRFSLFGSLSAGTIGPDPDSFLRDKYYTSFGLGFRLFSDRLVFDAYEFKFVYVPDLPENSGMSAFDFSSVRDVTGGDFTPGPPGPPLFQ